MTSTAIIFIGKHFVLQCPPLMTGHFKNGTDYNFWSRNHKYGPIFMFDVILGSGDQKSIFRSTVYILRKYFWLISKNLPHQGGTQRLIKSFPCAENIFFSLTDDIFVICYLKVTKNNKNTYHNKHFEKKLPKKYLVPISSYVPSCECC